MTTSGSRVYLTLVSFVALGMLVPAQTFAATIFSPSPTLTITRSGGVALPGFSNGIGLASSGSYIYTADAGAAHQFDVISIANPSNPVLVGSVSDLSALNGAFTIRVQGTYAFVTANSSNRLTVIDISNPAAPKIVASLSDARLGNPRGLYVSGSYAYVVGNTQPTFTIVDISKPTAPVILSSIKDNTRLAGGDSVVVQGAYAYVTAGSANALTVINIANPSAPTITGSVSSIEVLGNAKELVVSGQYAYVTALASNSVAVIDISNSAAPTIVNYVQDSAALYGPKNLTLSGNYLYMSTNNGHGLTMLSILSPNAPIVVASYKDDVNLSNARGVLVLPQGTYVISGGILNAFTITSQITIVPPPVPTSPTSAAGAITSVSTVQPLAGSVTINGTAANAKTVSVIIYPLTDLSVVTYRNKAIPVTNGQWTVNLPYTNGVSYLLELHTAESSPSLQNLLAYKRIVWNPLTQTSVLK